MSNSSFFPTEFRIIGESAARVQRLVIRCSQLTRRAIFTDFSLEAAFEAVILGVQLVIHLEA